MLALGGGLHFSGTNWSIRSTGPLANLNFTGGSITFSGTANASGFIHAYVLGNVTVSGVPAFTNQGATGRRYFARTGGRIITGGKGQDFFPGTEAGDTDANSIYA